MRRSVISRRAFCAGALTAPVGAAMGQVPAEKKGDEKPAKETRGKWYPLFQRHADEYRIRVAGDTADAQRMTDPVLRWWQPVRGGDDGALYIWVTNGRPVAAITFFTFKWPDGNRAIVHERHSFAEGPIDADWRGSPVWKTSKPGVAFRPVPDAPPPAATAPARLRQMQSILRDVSAVTTDDKNSNWPQRVLNKPLYRFEGKTDGALFALAQGTDPEAFVLLEARGEGSSARWEFAVARFTDLQLRITLKGAEVFRGPNSIGQPNDVYHSITVIQKPGDNPEDFR